MEIRFVNSHQSGIARNTIKKYVLLHLLFLFGSLSAAIGKYASYEDFLSFRFILFYGINLAVLFVYSIFWQFILRKFELTVAFSHRAAITIWGLLWGTLLFGEAVSVAKVLAAALIVAGIILIGGKNE